VQPGGRLGLVLDEGTPGGKVGKWIMKPRRVILGTADPRSGGRVVAIDRAVIYRQL
jgi:hypothetical protein